jgi:cyclopropane-fatty-acyl-phospholipid synthase
LLQAIALRDQYHQPALRAVGFIQRFVVPGSFISSVTAITKAVRRATDTMVIHLEGIGGQFATTRRHGRRNLHAYLPQVRGPGKPEDDLRRWDRCLNYSARAATPNASLATRRCRSPVTTTGAQ